MADPVIDGKGPWQWSIDGRVMSVLPATVLQMNNEANNLVLDSDHHNACSSVHVNRIGSMTKRGDLSLYKLTNCWQPLCCKALSGNATPCQQHWAYSFQKLPSNHYFVKQPLIREFLYLVSVAPFVGPVGTTSCCALWGPDGVLSPLQWTSMHLHRCMENAGWSSRRFVPFLRIGSVQKKMRTERWY